MGMIRRVTVAIVFALPALCAAGEDRERQWPAWRGPWATGVAPHADPPVAWGRDQNIRWKTALPGKGHATPIVWGDRIYVTAAEPIGDALPPRYSERPGAHDNRPVTHRQRFLVIALDRADGKVLWETAVHEALPVEGGHDTGSLASNSPVTDGERIFAFFGSQGLYALDAAGRVIWKAHLGQMHTKHGHGEGASPVLHGDTLFVNWDHEEESYLYAFDARTGEIRWKAPRDEPTSWSTPLVVEVDGKLQVIVSATNRVRGYDAETGHVIWECGGLSHNVVASPVYDDGLLIAGSSYDKRAMFAIRLGGAAGNLTDTDHVLWRRNRGTPYVPSPLLYDGVVYFHAHYQNVLTRLDARTGVERPGAMRLPGIGNVYASPVAAAGRIYITDLQGRTLVMTNTDEPAVLAINELGEGVSASPALVSDSIFLRGERHLYHIGRTGE